MEKFITITSGCIPVEKENVDTDQIMPARFLVSIMKTGYGENMFRDWRYADDGSRKESVFDNPEYQGHKILVAGHNFGCGSSREHAVWGLVQYGFQVVVSSMCADIFKNNALKNGLLIVEIGADKLAEIFVEIAKDAKFQLTVDLANQEVSYIKSADGSKVAIKFDIDPFSKKCIMQGMDDTSYILSMEDTIKDYEGKMGK